MEAIMANKKVKHGVLHYIIFGFLVLVGLFFVFQQLRGGLGSFLDVCV